jgi:hypothetical protein
MLLLGNIPGFGAIFFAKPYLDWLKALNKGFISILGCSICSDQRGSV